MTMPRFSISGLMGLVALVALEVWACQSLMRPPTGPPHVSDLIIFGMLPMANVLAIGLIPFLTRAGRARERPGLLGFEVFGMLAMILFAATCWWAGREIHDGVGEFLRRMQLRPGGVIFLTLAVASFLLPQLAMAALGAWLSLGYKVRVKVVIERRGIGSPKPLASETPADQPPLRTGGFEFG